MEVIGRVLMIKWIKILITQRESKLEIAQQQAKEKEAIFQEFSFSCLFPKWLQVLNRNVKKIEDSLVYKKRIS